MNQVKTRPIIFMAMTGASGAPYCQALGTALLAYEVDIFFTSSPTGMIILADELDQPELSEANLIEQLWGVAGTERINYVQYQDWRSLPASGKNPIAGMVICPTSMGTMGRIASGSSESLITRGADVCLKENIPLIIVPRETPLNDIQLENMLKLSRAGAVIMPAAPGFYHQPKSIADLVDFMVERIVNMLERTAGIKKS